MKKITLLVCALACLVMPSAFATITVTATPSSQSIADTAGTTFNVTLTLNVTGGSPTDIKNFDVIFEGLATQNGSSISNFGVTNYTPPSSRPDWQRISMGTDAFGSLATDHSGFLQTLDEGASGDGSSTSLTANFSLGTWTFTLLNTVTPGTYNFDTTVQGTSPSHFSDMFASTGGAMPFSNSATFSVNVVPEPATWSLLCLGGLGAFGVNVLRARRRD